MVRIFHYTVLILFICTLIMEVGCNNTNLPATAVNLIENTDSTVQNIQKISQNSDKSNLMSTGLESIDSLKSIEIENLNDGNNSKVTFNLPDGWFAKKLIYDKAQGFEFNAEKNKHIEKVYSFEFFNLKMKDKYKQLGFSETAGRLEIPSYYRDQPERTRFPNHCQVKARIFEGNTILGQGEIFILDCDIPDDLRTDKYSTYEMVYAWIPIKDEALAYNLYISVPLGEKADEYIEVVKNMLNAGKKAYINPDDIEWITMQGGLHIHTKALFPGHDDEKINRIVDMVNAGTGKVESTKTEINVINSSARPIGIQFNLKNGSKVYAWTDYTVKSFKNGWSATILDDRFVLNTQNNNQDEYFTIFSKDVAKYLREDWEAEMPVVKEIEVSSESCKDRDMVVIRDGDTAVVTGDGCTVKEVVIRIMRNGNPKEIYTVGKATPVFGQWEWKGAISRQCKTLDYKTVTLEKDLYDIIVDAEGSQTGVCGVIDLRDK